MTNRIAEIKKRLKQGKYYVPYAPDDISYLLSQLDKSEKGRLENVELYNKYIVLCHEKSKKLHELEAQLAERDAEIERMREAIASVHKSLDFADSQRQSSKNYTELAINNGLALGRIAVTLKHDFKQPLPTAPEEGAEK